MGTAGFPPQTLLLLGEANSLGRGQAGPAAGAVLPRRLPCCLAWTAALPWRTRPGGRAAASPALLPARSCCATCGHSSAFTQDGEARCSGFTFCLCSPISSFAGNTLSLLSPSVSTTALELLDWGPYFVCVPRPAGSQAHGPQDVQQISKQRGKKTELRVYFSPTSSKF